MNWLYMTRGVPEAGDSAAKVHPKPQFLPSSLSIVLTTSNELTHFKFAAGSPVSGTLRLYETTHYMNWLYMTRGVPEAGDSAAKVTCSNPKSQFLPSTCQ